MARVHPFFPNKYHLEELKTLTKIHNVYLCDQCGYCSNKAANVTAHIFSQHKTDICPYACNFCGKRFNSWSKVENHFKICERIPGEFRLTLQQKHAAWNESRRIRTKQEPSTKLQKCQFCDKRAKKRKIGYRLR